MRRSMLGIAVAIGALFLGIVAFARGQYWIGVCCLVLGALRIGLPLWQRRRTRQEPAIHLNINDEGPSDDAG